MPIQSDDLGIYKSAVMADVPEGGGGATGTAIVDGVSNAIFNDVSDSDRAGGAFHLRKGFGKVNTDDQGVLLGSGWVVLDPPADPAVAVTLFETAGWFDERTEAVKLVESTMVKGPRLLCRIQDTHYAGVSLLQLYNVAPAKSFPAAGDAVVLRNPAGAEIKVRVLRITESSTTVFDAGGEYVVNIATCELDKALTFDILGAPISRTPPSASSAATVFSTAPAVGARFHGVKPLSTAITLGASPIREVNVSGGIYSQLVPASTVPQPVIDQFPLVQRPTLSRTATLPLTLTTTGVTLTAGTVLQLPTAAQPGTLTMTHGATVFGTNGAGELLQGSTLVGNVDWTARTLTMLGTAPNYGSSTNAITYTPATVTGATAHSRSITVTDANRSLAIVLAMEPPPAPGTLTVSYMAQGRWYDLVEDGTGKLAGADSSYGAGTLSFVTGSLAASLGALPDVGSVIIVTWGEAASAVQATGMPTRAWSYLPLSRQPVPGSMTIGWARGGTTYTATVAADGTVTGPAQTKPVELQDDGTYLLPFSPNTLPDGAVTTVYMALDDENAFTAAGSVYTLTNAPIKPGSVHFKVVVEIDGVSTTAQAYSVDDEVFADGVGLIGTINNTTGVMSLSVASQTETIYTQEKVAAFSAAFDGPGISAGVNYIYATNEETVTKTITTTGIVEIVYQPDETPTAENESSTPTWLIEATPPIGLQVVTSGLAFSWAGVLHFSRDGSVFKAFHPVTGAVTTVGAADDNGRITLGQVAAGASNAVVWHNIAHDRRGGLDVFQGVFRVPVAPIQAGQFQLQVGSLIASADSGGVLTGDFTGLVDSLRGVVSWAVAGLGAGPSDGVAVRADEVTYNAVYQQFVPLNAALLGVDTSGLPADGKIVIFYPGGQVLVHHTDTFTFPNPLTKGTAYSLGRARVASVVVRDAVGTRLPGTLYEVNRTTGTVTIKTGSDITTYAQPFTAQHRVQDQLQVLSADISGKLVLAGALTHNYPLGSYVSSILLQGDKFARVFGYADRAAWSSTWDATKAGSGIAASYNNVDYPITTTNRGAIKERWYAIFQTTTTVDIYGENVGLVLDNVSIATTLEAINPQTSAPYWSIPSAGWGGGRSAGNVLLWETQAAGAPAWIARSVQPGGTEVLDDSATFAYIANVDTP